MVLITFPRVIPDEWHYAGLSFFPEPMIEVTPLRSGRQVSADLGPTLWRAKYQASDLSELEAGAVRAWYDTLMSAEAFYGFDKLREYPLLYRSGFGGLTVDSVPFTGVGTLQAVASNNVQPTIGDLPIGFILSRGDYIAFDYGSDARALHRVSAEAIADGSGNMTVEVRPHIRTGWITGAAVMLARPSAKMIIVPGTYADPIKPPGLVDVSFEAIQTL